MKPSFWMCTLIVTGVLLTGGQPLFAQQAAPEFNPQQFQQAMQQMGQWMAGGSNKVELVNFRELKALLPASLPGLKRISASGERSGAFGMSVAFAEARYKGSPRGYVTIKLSDMGGMKGMMALAHAGWAAADIDRETETGYEKTYSWKGGKAHEEYDTSRRGGAFSAILYKRFLFEVSGEQISKETLLQARDAVGVDKLPSLLPEQPGS